MNDHKVNAERASRKVPRLLPGPHHSTNVEHVLADAIPITLIISQRGVNQLSQRIENRVVAKRKAF